MSEEELGDMIRRFVLAMERVSVDIEQIKNHLTDSECDIWSPTNHKEENDER